MVKFSIIIPCYNEEKYIERCLKSIFSQTFDKNKYEVIVIDDGSDDKSIDIIKKFDTRLFYSKRLCAGGARNIGIENASGEYIILLDADDYLYKNDVLYKLDKSLNNEDIVFVKYLKKDSKEELVVEETGLNSLNEQIYKSIHFCCTLKCFKKQLVSNIRYKERCYHEDISFTMELMCKATSLLYFDDIFYVYYKENNTSTIDNYTIKKAVDFLSQTLEYFTLADKYPHRKEALLNMINKEGYKTKISKLEDWIVNDKQYSYGEF